MVADINLLPKREKKSDRGRLYILIVFILFLLGATYFTYTYFIVKQDLALGESRKSEIDFELAELQLELDEAMEKQTASREAAVLVAEYVSYDVTPIIRDVHTRLPNHGYLREYDFAVGHVTLHADFEDKTLITLFLTSLQSSQLFSDVMIEEISSFYPNASDGENSDAAFEELPRYSATFTLFIDMDQARVQGVRK